MSEFGFHTSFIIERNPLEPGKHISSASQNQCAGSAGDRVAGCATKRERSRRRPGSVTLDTARTTDFKRNTARICRSLSSCAASTFRRCAKSTSWVARNVANSDSISGCLFRRTVGAAQIGPIDIRPQVFAVDSARRFALDIDTQRFAKPVSCRNGLSYVADGRSAASCKTRLVCLAEAVDVSKKLIHAGTLPDGNIEVNTIWSFTQP